MVFPLQRIPLITLVLLGISLAGVTNGARPTTSPKPPPPPYPPPPPQPVSPCAITDAAGCLAQMTTEEKVGQMTQAANTYVTTLSDVGTYSLGSILSGGGGGPNNNAGGSATAWADMIDSYQRAALNSRLKIPILYGQDAVHGVNNVAGATVYPHNIGLGAAGSTDLVKRIGVATREEMLAAGSPWTFAPCVAVVRDDRWGRSYESFGEDPALSAALGAAFIEGVQGSTTGVNGRDTALATAKHYLGDGGTKFGTGGGSYLIDQGDTQYTDESKFKATHLLPYEEALKVKVGSVMVTYSSINGQKVHGFKKWVTDVLKAPVASGGLGFEGFIVSDWKGIDQIDPASYQNSVIQSINAGIDMVMVPQNYKTFISTLLGVIDKPGGVPMSRIDDAVTRILKVKYALGLFGAPYADRTYLSTVRSVPHLSLAREAVAKSMVLLKKDLVSKLSGGPAWTFPLPVITGSKYTIGVAGTGANSLGNQCGGWTITWQGSTSTSTIVGTNIYKGIQDMAATGPVATVSFISTPKGKWTADIGIIVVAETPYAEGQGDSSTLALPAADVDAVKQVCGKVTTACIVVVVSGRPVILTDILPVANVVIAGWLPGSEGGGVADVLFGAQPFTGKLPVTWPKTVSQEPTNFDDGTATDPLFAKGYGLS